MARMRLSTAVFGSLVLMGLGATADAQTVKAKPVPQSSFTARETPTAPQEPLAPQATRKSLQWDSGKNQWGLRLDIDQQPNRDPRLKDAEVGAFYRLTPTFRIGGALGLSDKAPAPVTPPKPANKPLEQTAPRVKLETGLRF